MFSEKPSQYIVNPHRNPALTISEKLKHQRFKVAAWSALYAVAASGMFAVCGAITLVWFSQWLKALPVGVEPTLARLIADRPDILGMSCLGGAISLAITVGGTVGWRHLLGRENAPPKKVVFVIGGLPILLGCVGALLTVAKIGFVGVVALPLLLGATVAIVPFAIGLLAFGLLQLGLNLIGQSPVACEADELPADVAEYFGGFNAAAREAGLEFAGNFLFVPKKSKFRSVWIAPNGAYFADATYLSVGNTTIRAISVSGATDDGHFFTTADLSHPAAANLDGLEHCVRLPDAPLTELIERYVEIVAAWAEKTGSRPLVFDAADQHELFAYGLAAHLQQDSNDLLWLGNPYKNQPLPPLPGRSWQEDASFADG